MDSYSPRTSVRYGLSRINSEGNIVDVWNFGDLEAALNSIDSVGSENSPYEGGNQHEGRETLHGENVDIVHRALVDHPTFACEFPHDDLFRFRDDVHFNAGI